MKAARDAGIIVFPAFEAVTKDGVHFLCLFEQGKKAAELIAALSASGEAGRGHSEIPVDCEGSIDSGKVREPVEEILEGGREAFEMRRLKYGF